MPFSRQQFANGRHRRPSLGKDRSASHEIAPIRELSVTGVRLTGDRLALG
jgi:hypothetical protein